MIEKTSQSRRRRIQMESGTKKQRVVVGGTFDLIHPGHLYFLKKAREFGKLIVIVARDKNVERIKRHKPVIPERQRLAVVKGLKYVDEAILGSESDDLLEIMKELKPDIIVLGPDQVFSEEDVQNELRSQGLNVKIVRIDKVCDEHPLCHTQKIIKKILNKERKYPNR